MVHSTKILSRPTLANCLRFCIISTSSQYLTDRIRVSEVRQTVAANPNMPISPSLSHTLSRSLAVLVTTGRTGKGYADPATRHQVPSSQGQAHPDADLVRSCKSTPYDVKPQLAPTVASFKLQGLNTWANGNGNSALLSSP